MEFVFKCPGGGELPLSLCPGVGNRMPSEEKMANPGGVPVGGMATVGIEPCKICLNESGAYNMYL